MNTVYIGYDPAEDTAYEVLKFTIERISGKNAPRIVPIKRDILEHIGMYTRKSEIINGQPYDIIDGKPFSTQFSFSRFLVPALNLYDCAGSTASATGRFPEQRAKKSVGGA